MSPLPVFEIILMSTWPVCRDRHVLREFRRKISEFFSCVAFLLCVVDEMFTKVPLFKDNALPWEYPSSAPELHNHQGHDQISVSYCDSKKVFIQKYRSSSSQGSCNGNNIWTVICKHTHFLYISWFTWNTIN